MNMTVLSVRGLYKVFAVSATLFVAFALVYGVFGTQPTFATSNEEHTDTEFNDGDDDDDGYDNEHDNCPDQSNSEQEDWDNDNHGDACDEDEENNDEENDDENDDEENTPETGSLTITKQIVGDVLTWSFNLDVYTTLNEYIGDFTLSNSNTTKTYSDLASGVYIVGENIPQDWDLTDVTCDDDNSTIPILGGKLHVDLSTGEDVACVFTNTYYPPQEEICEDDSALNYGEVGECDHGDNGGGDSDEETYLVFGYVWNDADGDGADVSEQEEGESSLVGWTVSITDGETTYSTTTDTDGYYFFNVPAGTWTITDANQEDWQQTYPVIPGNTHEVIVAEEIVKVETESVLAMVMDFFISTAQAEGTLTGTPSNPFNFGYTFVGGVGGDGVFPDDNNNGGGGSSSGSKSSKKTVTNTAPEGEVLGASTVMPVGAPDTGAGGTAPVVVKLPSLFAILGVRTHVRKLQNA